jgi:D-alanine transaminase
MLYLDGRYLPIADGRVSVEDRGFQLGDGVYEVIRVYGGKPFRLQAHLRRLQQSLDGVEIALPVPLDGFAVICAKVTAALPESTIYIQVTRGTAPRVHAFPKDVRPTVVAYAREAKAPSSGKSFTLLSVADDRWGRCHLKTICLLPNLLAKEKAVRAGCDEGLFVRDDGVVTEGTTSNAFFVKDGVVLTHPANHRILNGVTRMALLEVARGSGVRVEEKPLTIDEVRGADEVFMTGTTTEVMPATSLDGKPVGSGKAGPVTLRLQAAFRDLIRRETGA